MIINYNCAGHKVCAFLCLDNFKCISQFRPDHFSHIILYQVSPNQIIYFNQNLMKKLFVFVFLIILAVQLHAQQKSLQNFLNEANVKPAKVMLVGTFHFAYQNLDMHKTDKKNMRNILSEKSQAELQEVLNVLKAYKPTRIYLEAKDQQWLDSSYNACTDSTLKTQPNERVQIGFRLAKEMKMAQVYAIDARELINDWNDADSALLEKVLGSDSVANKKHADSLGRIYGKYYTYTDSICANAPLLQAFIFMNEPRNLQLNHGAYLSGYFNTLSNYGPDFLSTWWINRNIRIFNKVLLTKPTGDDKILILFGAGHVPLLKQCFESSPDFDYVDFYKAAVKYADDKKISKNRLGK